MTDKREMLLISGNVIEKVAPALEVSFANAIAMSDYSISAECHLGWVGVDS